jgi:hypothetical protein
LKKKTFGGVKIKFLRVYFKKKLKHCEAKLKKYIYIYLVGQNEIFKVYFKKISKISKNLKILGVPQTPQGAMWLRPCPPRWPGRRAGSVPTS